MFVVASDISASLMSNAHYKELLCLWLPNFEKDKAVFRCIFYFLTETNFEIQINASYTCFYKFCEFKRFTSKNLIAIAYIKYG